MNVISRACNGSIRDMDREHIIAKLREHEAELKDAGLQHLSLFGSYARGTAVQSTSDVDVLADFDHSRRLTLFSLAGLRLRIVDILEMPVDLEIIWQTITDDLPPLKAAVLNALQSSRNRQK